MFDDNICHRPGRSGGQGARGGARSCSVSICVVSVFICILLMYFIRLLPVPVCQGLGVVRGLPV